MLDLSALGKAGPAGFERHQTQLFSVWEVLETTHRHPPPHPPPLPPRETDTQAWPASATSESPIPKSSSRLGLLPASRKLCEVIQSWFIKGTTKPENPPLPSQFAIPTFPHPAPRLANFAGENHKTTEAAVPHLWLTWALAPLLTSVRWQSILPVEVTWNSIPFRAIPLPLLCASTSLPKW